VPRLIALAAVAAVALAGCGGGGSGSEEELSAKQVVQRLKAQGLPIRKVEVYTPALESPELGSPVQYTSKVNFMDTRLDEDSLTHEIDTQEGGSVEVFENADDAAERADYVRGITENSSLLAEYGYLRDRVFLRLSHALTPNQAEAYNKALESL